jgi:Lung seven transmembrane receptor
VPAGRRYFDYVNFNATGFRPVLTTVWAVFLGCVRKTLSRMLVLVVSMGFGVVLPYLGAMQRKVR